MTKRKKVTLESVQIAIVQTAFDLKLEQQIQQAIKKIRAVEFWFQKARAREAERKIALIKKVMK